MKSISIACVAAALWLSPGSTAHAGDPATALPAGVAWKTLSFSASKWGNTVTTTVALESVDAGEAAAEAVEADRGDPVQASSARIFRIDVLTAIDLALAPAVRLINRFWFDPAGPAVLFGESSRLGQDEYLRRFRFTRQGAYRFRREPATPEEAGLPPERWSDAKGSFYPYDPSAWGCGQVAEPNVLIYLFGHIILDPVEPTPPLCVFHKRQLYRVAVLHRGGETAEVSYRVRVGDRDVVKAGGTRTAKLALEATPLGEFEGEAEGFSFLGFKDQVEVLLDPASRLPVMIRGDIPPIGRSELRLDSAQLAP